jgi:hypothetical protein
MIAKPTPEEFMLLALQLGREKFQHYIDLAKQEVQKGTSTPFEKKRELLLKARIMLPEEFAKFRAAVLEKYKFDSEEDKTGFLEALDNTRSISSDDFMEVLGMVKDSSITLKLKGENIKERILLAFMKLSAKQEEELLGMVKDSSIT